MLNQKKFVLTVIFFIGAHLVLLAQPVLDLPSRSANAKTGSEIVSAIENLSLADREEAILHEIIRGNVPDYLRILVPVSISQDDTTITFFVTPDYISLGNENDSFLAPMTPLLAQKTADVLDCSLPTKKIVDLIWSAAPLKLAPQPIPPGDQMTTVPVFAEHNELVQQQRKEQLSSFPYGTLVAGTKKDVIISNRYLQYSTSRVIIYGWHQLNGSPIQPVSGVHGETYADYSHGIRLVSRNVLINGHPARIEDILQDTDHSTLLSDEGALQILRYPVPLPFLYPLKDNFPPQGREIINWQDTFTTPGIVPFEPIPEGGNGSVLVVQDPAGGVETTWLGNIWDADYFVEARIYCDYRPELIDNGFERSGIFFRDTGGVIFEHHFLRGGGNCYLMAWDSADGRLWCAKVINGILIDLLPEARYETGSSWRVFTIRGYGNQIEFFLNGKNILSVPDDTFSEGLHGIGYHEYFLSNSNIRGARVDYYLADKFISETFARNWLQHY